MQIHVTVNNTFLRHVGHWHSKRVLNAAEHPTALPPCRTTLRNSLPRSVAVVDRCVHQHRTVNAHPLGSKVVSTAGQLDGSARVSRLTHNRMLVGRRMAWVGLRENWRQSSRDKQPEQNAKRESRLD